MLNRKLSLACAAMAASLVGWAQSAEAIVVTTNGSTTFDSGGFEANSLGGLNGQSPLVGTYASLGPIQQVVDDAAPGPAVGDQYLSALGTSNIDATLTSSASGSDIVHAEAYVYIPSTTTQLNGFSIRMTGTGLEATVRITGTGALQYETGGSYLTSALLGYSTNVWQLWETEINMATGMATFWIDGVQGEVYLANSWNAGADLDFVRFNSGTGTGGAYLDSTTIPEPASLGLLGLGGALMLRRRRAA